MSSPSDTKDSSGAAADADPLLARADSPRTIPLALVQFDAVSEQAGRNTARLQRLTEKAVAVGARRVMFHEGTLGDCTGRLSELAEPAPGGPHVRQTAPLARRLLPKTNH